MSQTIAQTVKETSGGIDHYRMYINGEFRDSSSGETISEVFVVDRSGAIRYQGRIDDQYQPGVARSEATQHDLHDAIAALIAGTEPVLSKTEAVGCLIGRTRGEPTDYSVTFCNQVARVLNAGGDAPEWLRQAVQLANTAVARIDTSVEDLTQPTDGP